ncbi:hypothetical protein [Armatimonas sp.]|uniref:hypothetical protein n=1 Tax=Armatimonas sp. TaxID=1872638 RepID=UPI003752DA1C
MKRLAEAHQSGLKPSPTPSLPLYRPNRPQNRSKSYRVGFANVRGLPKYGKFAETRRGKQFFMRVKVV